MEVWAILVASLLGFALVQLSLYIYFTTGQSGRSESSADGPVPGLPDGAGGGSDRPGDSGHADGHGHGDGPGHGDHDILYCRACGTANRNEQLFTFCKACGERLE